MKNRITKNDNLLSNARRLRKEMTRQEKKLWYDFLRYYPIKIYKQRIIGDYIADFYCASSKLVIELDGSQHFEEEAEQYDKDRTKFFEQFGLEVVRYTNLDVDRNFVGVCQDIELKIKERKNNPLRHDNVVPPLP